MDCVRPGPDDTVCDPACGTGGFLLAAHEHVVREHGSTLDPDQKAHLRTNFVQGWEIVPAAARLCIMNLYLHGIAPEESPIRSGVDSLANDPGDRFSMVLTNPPFGKKSSVRIVNEEGELETESDTYERQDFWTGTKKQAAELPPAREDAAHDARHLRHRGAGQRPVRGRRGRDRSAQPAAGVRRAYPPPPPDRDLLRPRGEGEVLFFDAKPAREKPWTERLWVYDLRTNKHFTLKMKPLRRADLDDFVTCYRPGERHKRKPTWSSENDGGRWRAFEYDELAKRDKLNLDSVAQGQRLGGRRKPARTGGAGR